MYGCAQEAGNEDWLSEWRVDASTATESVGCRSLSSSASTCRPESVAGDFANRYDLDIPCSWVEWDVVMELSEGASSEGLGLEAVPTMDGTALAVAAIESDGQVASWNASNQLHHIRLGDIVLQVNIVSDSSEEMLKELAGTTQVPAVAVTLRLARARCLEIPALVNCSGSGNIIVAKQVQATRMQDCSPLQIVSLSDSLVAQQQELSRPPELCIWPGDVVIAVNGYQQPEEVLRELERAPRLEVTLQRPVPGTFESYMAANQHLQKGAKGQANRSRTVGIAVGQAFRMLRTAMKRPLRSQGGANSKEMGATPVVASNDNDFQAIRESASPRFSSSFRHSSLGATPIVASNSDDCEAVRVSVSGRLSSSVRHSSSIRSRLSADRCQRGTTSFPEVQEILL